MHHRNGEKRTIDIFTTEKEIPLAGHPTIGAASWFLHHTPSEDDKKEVRRLITKSGKIPVVFGFMRQGSR
ncbi:hypothetical protein BDV29DRAFT_181625 [Aspergillus leporis]|uniref:PhzF family phenazine biosynthesis protein n=1 Tax=Aspergillus leporis TaxID=41062 RepID=A0A5N5WS78_9EURO|nr:hypothetical protein BDV29DRAFT_181625 [Aspergillus leporis]